MSALLNRDFLVKNLCFMYRLMVASAPLLEFAEVRSTGALRNYYAKHLAEEVGHDSMLLADLHDMGIKDVPYDYAASQLAGAQYYLVAHHHPALLLGYMAVLEGSSLSIATIDEAEAKHGCRLTAVRHHAEHDPLHAPEIAKLIATLPQDVQAAIEWNASGVRQIIAAESERWLHG